MCQIAFGVILIAPHSPEPAHTAEDHTAGNAGDPSSTFRPTSSARLSPHPISSDRMARSRLPRAVSDGNLCKSVLDCSIVSQFPTLTPNRLAPLTRRMPAANSGLNRQYRQLRRLDAGLRPIVH
jgi:hypothetical protein